MARLFELDPDECLRLLRTQVVGRVAVETDTGVDIYPVNYAVVDNTLHIRTAPGGPLARWAADRIVVFEVDEVDPDNWAGWSVVVKGPAEVLPAADAESWEQILPRARSWTGDDELSLVLIRWDSVTGRRIGG